MLGCMTERFAVRREMCYSPECLPQDRSGVLGFTEAIYGTDMCEVVPEERPRVS